MSSKTGKGNVKVNPKENSKVNPKKNENNYVLEIYIIVRGKNENYKEATQKTNS